MYKIILTIVSNLFLCASLVYADIERVSVSSTGVQGNADSYSPSISSDGRYVAFVSENGNLVVDDTNFRRDIFVHDQETGINERIDGGAQSFPASRYSPSISADGRFVVFISLSSDLVAGDTNDHRDIFVYERDTQTTERVNVSSDGVQGDSFSYSPSISADGRYVAFVSEARNLVAGDTNRDSDIFVHDRNTGITERVSVSSAGVQSNGDSFIVSISSDGRFVLFGSAAINLVVGDTNDQRDIFVHDRNTGITERVNVSSAGAQSNAESYTASISSDGRFVAFSSAASNLVADDTNNNDDIFVHDRDTGITERVNVSSIGVQGYGRSASPSISADGRFVTFTSFSSNLVLGDANNKSDSFVHDRVNKTTQWVSVSSTGEQGNADSYTSSISADGRFVALLSYASNLVEDDTNNSLDVFVSNNPLVDLENNTVLIEKLINNEVRDTQNTAAKLSAGTLYKQSYKVTNTSADRIYQVEVFDDGNMVCNFYSVDPGEIKERCVTSQTVLEGNQQVQINVRAKLSSSGETLLGSTDAYYTGLNGNGELRVTHRINDINANRPDQAQSLDSSQATVSYKVENTGEIELYQIKTYHDPVSPVNGGWDLQCNIGPIKPGQARYCSREITLSEPGLNQAMGRVQGRNAIRSATDVINASNPTYFIVP